MFFNKKDKIAKEVKKNVEHARTIKEQMFKGYPHLSKEFQKIFATVEDAVIILAGLLDNSKNEYEHEVYKMYAIGLSICTMTVPTIIAMADHKMNIFETRRVIKAFDDMKKELDKIHKDAVEGRERSNEW